MKRGEVGPEDAELQLFLRELWPSLWYTLVDGININDDQGRFVFVSPAYCRLVGYEEHELVGESFLKVIPEQLRAGYLQSYERTMRLGVSGQDGEFQLQHKDGRRVHISTRNTVLELGDRRLHAFITRDITDRRTLELQVMHGDRIRALGTLAGGVAHEFNNLLVSIQGYAEMIADQPVNELVVRYADKIKRAARRGAEITGQLLPFSRREEFHKEPVDLHEVLRESAELFRLSNADGATALELDLGAAESWVCANSIQLHQAFLNLFLNARDAMSQGGTVRAVTRVVAARGGEPAQIEAQVIDSGCGISDEARRKLFEPFFTTKKTGKGTGLGLALVYSTVTSHGGTIAIDSAPECGTTVNVRFPLERPS